MCNVGSDAYICHVVDFLSTIAFMEMECDKGLTQLRGSTRNMFESEDIFNYFGTSLRL